ncbi:MAG: glycosyltransferase family 4 protein, partial [Solirubrobacteraceae bacterium]|nr:glycosyltransferase family 4 protein [Solirubrobacteraceae bacterium]
RHLPVDLVAGDDLVDELSNAPGVRYLNLRGDPSPNVSLTAKCKRLLGYYASLMAYAFRSRAPVFHILWNNKFEWFDRTVLMLYYKLLGKKIVLTAHNVNIAARDGHDSALSRASLGFQYALCDHIFVHTQKMQDELHAGFGIARAKTSVIPFGINNTSPKTALGAAEAKRRLGLDASHRTLLFFGNIAPYKGLEYLVEAISIAARTNPSYRLVIAGRPKGSEQYWSDVHSRIDKLGLQASILERTDFVPDEEVEVYFKAADVLVLPYTHVFQSGVLSLAYSFGLPVIASDVGSLADDIVPGRTGLVCRARDPHHLAERIDEYFASDVSRDLANRRADIELYANGRYSWAKVGEMTESVYRALVERRGF